MIQSALLSQFSNLAHGFSVLEDSLPTGGNMSLNSGPWEEVLHNRRRFCDGLGLDAEAIVMVDQVHGNHVLPVTRADRGKGARSLMSALGEADALCTDETGVPLTVLVADCAAVFCYDPERHVIGLAHSGWRGTAQGIVPRLVATMNERFACRPQQLSVWVSPSLGPCCFEVGPEVLDAFRQSRPELARREDWCRPAPSNENKWMLDLNGLIYEQLIGSGIPDAQIDPSPACTFCGQGFFSYRRDGKGTGHMMALLAMKGEL